MYLYESVWNKSLIQYKGYHIKYISINMIQHHTSLIPSMEQLYDSNAKYNSHTDPSFKSCGILKLMFKINRDMPDARLTRQSDLLLIDRCQSKFASSLPLYSLPIVWNRWVFLVSNPMSRIQFKTKKLACINKYLSPVKCNYRRCPDCYPSTTNKFMATSFILVWLQKLLAYNTIFVKKKRLL